MQRVILGLFEPSELFSLEIAGNTWIKLTELIIY